MNVNGKKINQILKEQQPTRNLWIINHKTSLNEATVQVPEPTCDVVLFERIAVDLVLIGTVFLQPFAHVLLGPQGHWLGQLHISCLYKIETQ